MQAFKQKLSRRVESPFEVHQKLQTSAYSNGLLSLSNLVGSSSWLGINKVSGIDAVSCYSIDGISGSTTVDVGPLGGSGSMPNLNEVSSIEVFRTSPSPSPLHPGLSSYHERTAGQGQSEARGAQSCSHAGPPRLDDRRRDAGLGPLRCGYGGP